MKFKGYNLQFGNRTLVMGILNVTPDSFSDGGLYLKTNKAIERGCQMAEEGADIIDVGGESTRPFSKRVSLEEEMERVLPVIEGLKRHLDIPISIDTYKAKVAQEAIKAGASIVNDISALRFDEQMIDVIKKEDVPVILMHMKGTPEDMQLNPVYEDVVSEIKEFFSERINTLSSQGLRKDMMILDPGIGFGKNLDHNLRILKEIETFYEFNMPVLLGTSNKSFIGKILNNQPHEREAGTLASVAYAAMKGVHIVRVHSVKKSVEVIKIITAIKSG